MKPIVLASGSRYRRALMNRLGVPLEVAVPGIDESRRRGESVPTLVTRLAAEKAAALEGLYPDRLIIGSDQLLAAGRRTLGKPGTPDAAVEQLRWSSGRQVRFLTAVCLLDASSGRRFEHLSVTRVKFRTLSDEEIQRYVEIEPALDCAGSFRIEGLGITLCEWVRSDDPTGLIGLPLIAVRRLLAEAGQPLP